MVYLKVLVIFMNKEECAKELIKQFPEKEDALSMHYIDYGEILPHVFFSEEVNVPLIALLHENKDAKTILKYCALIETMWSVGTEDIQNVVDVTILERLSDEENVWRRFGTYISDEFRRYINDSIIKENCMMWGVSRL